jgi:cell division septation protein DedD
LVDTRTGEILWRAEQIEQDYQGLAKIPTGISSAILGPIRFVTNKLNLRRITSKLVTKLTAIVKNPKDAEKKETFEEPLIASSTTRDLEKIKTVNDLKAEWREDSAAYTKVPFSSKSQKNIRERPASARQQFVPETDEIQPNHINWVPRKTSLQKVALESLTKKINQPSIFTTFSENSIQVQSKQIQYTIQVGAFKAESNANQMVSELLKKGYQAHITPDTKNVETIFKIHIDEFGNKKQAEKVSEKFNSEENLSSFVTTIGQN